MGARSGTANGFGAAAYQGLETRTRRSRSGDVAGEPLTRIHFRTYELDARYEMEATNRPAGRR